MKLEQLKNIMNHFKIKTSSELMKLVKVNLGYKPHNIKGWNDFIKFKERS